MCLDYRKVNKQLTTDIHPLPNLEELVEHVAGNQYFTALDLKDAYYQVLLDEASRDLTTFSERRAGRDGCTPKTTDFSVDLHLCGQMPWIVFLLQR